MLPAGLKNPRKVPVRSDPFINQVPSRIPPLSEKQEKTIVGVLFREINSVFGLNLETEPNVARKFEPPTSTGSSRTVVIGASHMTRVVDALIIEGEDVSGLCSPGWTPDQNGIA